MATSDSEDFQSADEDWADEIVTSVDKDRDPECASSSKELTSENTENTNKLKEVVPGDKTESEITNLLEKNVVMKETKLHTLPHEEISGKRAEVIETGNRIKEKNDTECCDTLKSLKKSKDGKDLECSETPPENTKAPVTEDSKESQNDKPKILDYISKEQISKDVKTNEDNAMETSFAAEIDGWECEDEGLIEDLIEEQNNASQIDSVLNKLSESVGKEETSSDSGVGSSWSGWGSWGMTSLLSTATESVSTLTTQVSQGLSTVLETGLGVPDPEELVKQEIEQEKKLSESLKEKDESNPEEKKNEEDHASLFGLGQIMSGVSSITKLVETASSKVVTGGLDTLETIGKKTMEVLQEGDPGLRKKRAIFSEKVVLSQLLREAKDKAEQEDRMQQNTKEARKVHFETLFDDYHGLVHLEALEMLSKQSSIKVQSILLNTSSSDVEELQELLAEIKELCQLRDDDYYEEGESFETLEEKLANVGKGLGVPIANEKLIKTWQEINLWLKDCRRKQKSTPSESGDIPAESPVKAQEIHQMAINTLARLTAEAVEQFHKTSELLLVYEKRKPTEEAKILLDMSSVFSSQVSTAAAVFSENLNTCSEYAENPDAVNEIITNVFLEAANSSSYIQEAFQLLIPVLQVGIVTL